MDLLDKMLGFAVSVLVVCGASLVIIITIAVGKHFLIDNKRKPWPPEPEIPYCVKVCAPHPVLVDHNRHGDPCVCAVPGVDFKEPGVTVGTTRK